MARGTMMATTPSKRRSRAKWVACGICEAKFPGAYGCNSHVYRERGVWYVQGYYGSRLHDMRRYKVVGGDTSIKPNKVQQRNVCDLCVESWVLAKSIEYVGDNPEWL